MMNTKIDGLKTLEKSCIFLNFRDQAFKSTTPLFLVHSILGDPVNDYAEFAKLIDIDIPLWGLRVSDDPDRLTTIESMASEYCQQIRRIQSRGPYFLGGLSAGGTIAWEMARQLTDQNEQVTLLLLDSISPDIWRNLAGSLHTSAVYYLGFFLLPEKLRTEASILQQMCVSIEHGTTNKMQIEYLFEYLLRTSDAINLNRIQIAYGILRAIYDYQPKPINVKLHVFKASEAFISCDDHLGWPVKNGKATIIPGNHQSFLTDPQLIAAIKERCQILI